MFSAKHSFADMRECNLRKNKTFTKIGGGLPECKKVFYLFTFLVLVVLFFVSLCFCGFVLLKKAQKGHFPAILEVFVYFVPQKACLWNPSFLPILFSFLPFKTPFYPFAFWPSAPFSKTLIFLVSLSFFFLPFPFLMFACFFQTNFPNIPFLKPKLLSFWLFIYFFCCSCFCFHCVCFSLSVFMLALFWVFFLFCVFVSVFFLILLSIY